MSEKATSSNRYPRLTLDAVGRALSLQDANPLSKTYGCCDRSYWQYKTITGFPAATMQQLALPFAVLYTTRFDGNDHVGDAVMLERAKAAMLFWTRTQHRNGAFDEWFHNEFSHCATAFTAFAMSECLLLLGHRLDRETAQRVTRHLVKAAGWLAARFNDQVMNQNLAACAALWNTYRLTEDEAFRVAFASKWERTLKHLDQEGWFSEYGGADLGYGTLALDLLAALERRECEANVRPVAEKLCAYLASFVCRSGGLAGRLGSRGTACAFPFGAEFYAASIPAGSRMASHFRRGYAHQELPTPADVDDRYLAYFYLPQFSLACTLNDRSGAEIGRAEVPNDVTWSRSGFVIWRRESGDVVCSLRRQGAFNVYTPGRPEHCNMGYWAETATGSRWSSAFWNRGWLDADQRDGDGRVVRGRFVRVRDELPLAGGSLAFTLFSEWVFRWSRLAEWFQGLIRKRRIFRRTEQPLKFERVLQWKRQSLHVTDTITALAGCPRLRAIGPVDDIDVHCPSARVRTGRPWSAVRVSQEEARRWAGRLSQRGSLRIELTYTPDALGRLVPGSISVANGGGMR